MCVCLASASEGAPATSSDPSEGLARATRQHDDAGSRSAVPEHLAERLFLVWPNFGRVFEGRRQLGIVYVWGWVVVGTDQLYD